jgi:hypothetical protein
MPDRMRSIIENLPVTYDRDMTMAIALKEGSWPTRQEIEYRMLQDGIRSVVLPKPEVQAYEDKQVQEDEDVG